MRRITRPALRAAVLSFLVPLVLFAGRPCLARVPAPSLAQEATVVEPHQKLHVVSMSSTRYIGALLNNALNMERLGMPLDVVYALDHLTLSLCLSALRTSTTRCEHLESTSTVASAAHAAAEEADAAVGPRRSLQSDGKKKTAGDAKKPMGQNKGAKGATSGSAKASVEETTSYVRNLKLKFTIFQRELDAMETNQTMLFLDATAFILNRDCVEHLRESSIDITAESGFSCPTNVVEQLGVSANTGFLMMRKSEALEQFVASMRDGECSMLCCEQQIFNEKMMHSNFTWLDSTNTTATFDVPYTPAKDTHKEGVRQSHSSLSVHFLDPHLWTRNQHARKKSNMCLYHPKTPYSDPPPDFRSYMSEMGFWLVDAWSLLEVHWWPRVRTWLHKNVKLVGEYNFPNLSLSHATVRKQSQLQQAGDDQQAELEQHCHKAAEKIATATQLESPPACACAPHLQGGALQRAVRVQDGVNLLFFFHVHKAGGTSICQLAKENMRTSTSHECLPDMNAGYLNQVADRAGTNGTNGLHYCFLAHASPELLLSLREDVYPLEMIASESALPDRFPYSRAHISWMTQLREPLARTVSAYHWWMHERDIPKGRIYVNEAGEYWKRGDCHLYEQRANASLVEWLEAYPDNFMTRAFCGGSVMYDVPHLQLNESHLECAKRRLATFAPILILERPERLQLMQESLGWRTRDVWQNAMLTPGGSDPRQTKPGDVESSSALASLTEEELKMLRRTHQLDMRLYKYATDLFEQQLEFYGIPLAPTAAAVDTNDTTSCAGEAA